MQMTQGRFRGCSTLDNAGYVNPEAEHGIGAAPTN
jgi:hypothetical protein